MITIPALQQSGCLAYYPFKNNTKDMMGTYDASTTSQYTVNQTGSEHIILDGTTKIELPEPVTASSIGTFCGWISCTSLSDVYIVTRCRTTANRIFSIRYWYASGQMRFIIQVNNSGAPNDSIYTVIKDPIPWHHIAVVANGSSWQLYVNGALQPTVILSGSNSGKWGSTITSHDYYTIGSMQYNNGEEVFSSFKSKDFMFFNTALDKNQINAIIMDTIIY